LASVGLGAAFAGAFCWTAGARAFFTGSGGAVFFAGASAVFAAGAGFLAVAPAGATGGFRSFLPSGFVTGLDFASTRDLGLVGLVFALAIVVSSGLL
jgi:hypothetical protein